MASSFGSYSMLVFLLFVFMLVGPSFAEKYTKLRGICSKTTNPHLCMELMKSDSRTADADILSLIDVAIDLAYSKAKNNYKKLFVFTDYPPEHMLNDRYNSCSPNYQDAIRDLEQTRKLFNDGDYKRIAVQVNDATGELRDCKDQIEKWRGYPSNLNIWNKEFELICDVVKVSSKSLSGKRSKEFVHPSNPNIWNKEFVYSRV